jgi:hypothetical protein
MWERAIRPAISSGIQIAITTQRPRRPVTAAAARWSLPR